MHFLVKLDFQFLDRNAHVLHVFEQLNLVLCGLAELVIQEIEFILDCFLEHFMVAVAEVELVLHALGQLANSIVGLLLECALTKAKRFIGRFHEVSEFLIMLLLLLNDVPQMRLQLNCPFDRS